MNNKKENLIMVAIGTHKIKTYEYTLVKVANKSKKYYLNKGYIEKNGYFKVKTSDIPEKSNIKIERFCLKCGDPSLINVFNIRPCCEECTRSETHEGVGRQEGKLVVIPDGTFSKEQKEFRTKEFIYVNADNKSIKNYSPNIIKQSEGLLKIRTLDLAGNSRIKIEIKCPITGEKDYYKPLKGCCCEECNKLKLKEGKYSKILESKEKIEKLHKVRLIEFSGLDHDCTYTKRCCNKVFKSSGRNLLVRGPKKCEHLK